MLRIILLFCIVTFSSISSIYGIPHDKFSLEDIQKVSNRAVTYDRQRIFDEFLKNQSETPLSIEKHKQYYEYSKILWDTLIIKHWYSEKAIYPYNEQFYANNKIIAEQEQKCVVNLVDFRVLISKVLLETNIRKKLLY
jgi:hypothetical protein